MKREWERERDREREQQRQYHNNEQRYDFFFCLSSEAHAKSWLSHEFWLLVFVCTFAGMIVLLNEGGAVANEGGAVANRLRHPTSDQTVLGSNPAVAALLPLSQGEAFTLASISYLAILVNYILAKKKKKKKKRVGHVLRLPMKKKIKVENKNLKGKISLVVRSTEFGAEEKSCLP